jgi:hypothetical protein
MYIMFVTAKLVIAYFLTLKTFYFVKVKEIKS